MLQPKVFLAQEGLELQGRLLPTTEGKETAADETLPSSSASKGPTYSSSLAVGAAAKNLFKL